MSARSVIAIVVMHLVLGVVASGSDAQGVRSFDRGRQKDPSRNGRSFLMGFTGFPYDFTIEAQQETYEHINRFGDIVSYHFDRGIPWEEALQGDDSYHSNLIAEIDGAVNSIRDGQRVCLALTPQSQARRGELALYWNEESEQPLPDAWASRSFDDPEVAIAYLNFARYLVDRFDPDYFVYAIETNGGFVGTDDPEFLAFTIFLSRVYPILKASYPDIPILLSVQASADGAPRDELLEMTRTLIVFSDLIGISTYPYLQLHFDGLVTPGDPGNIAGGLLTDIASLAPHKRIAITETGYAAETVVLPDLGLVVPSMAEWQREYVRWLMPRLNAMGAEFVIWFVSRDYDLALERVANEGFDIPDLYFVWRDNGLLDGDGDARASLGVWRSWLSLEHTPVGD